MAADNLQALLRFLATDAKVPLTTAIPKVKELQTRSLMTPESLAKSDLGTLQSVFADDKIAKQVLNAAKRVTKKRSTSEVEPSDSPTKRVKSAAGSSREPPTGADLEESLTLPTSDKSIDELESIELFTNRAPLVLAFCLTLLKYSMPDQPLSSRLSLAHAYVSISSRNRAVDLGIEKGIAAQEDGWGAGQPSVKIMGKDIKVMRRSGLEQDSWGTAEEDMSTQGTIDSQGEREPALWGLDLEALKSSSLAGAKAGHRNHIMPIYTPQSARSYLLRAAGSVPDEGTEGKSAKKQTAAAKAAEVEQNLGMLLKSIESVYDSWLPELGVSGIDSRTWGWYARVRPDIASGKAGWGAKNVIRLKDIVALRKSS